MIRVFKLCAGSIVPSPLVSRWRTAPGSYCRLFCVKNDASSPVEKEVFACVAACLICIQLINTNDHLQVTSIEPSMRLDAVASGGLGVSRTQMLKFISKGLVSVDHQRISTASTSVKVPTSSPFLLSYL